MTSKKKLTALIVDDNDVSRSMLRFILSSEQTYDVVGEAGNGALGLDLAERLQPDIICLDVSMPDMSGLEVLKQIKTQWPRITVLMVTGSNDRDSVLTALQGGANGYIVKPFNPVTLLRMVEQAVAKTQAATAAPPAADKPE